MLNIILFLLLFIVPLGVAFVMADVKQCTKCLHNKFHKRCDNE